MTIREKGGWRFIVGAGDFFGFPFPTRADALAVLTEIEKERSREILAPMGD